MHELGIVFHILDSVIDVAKENKVNRINKVTLEVGEVSSIVPSYLEDCWNWAVKKDPLTIDCKLNIEIIKGVTYCEDCQKTYPTVQYGKECPYCHSLKTYLQKGDEVNIKEIEVK